MTAIEEEGVAFSVVGMAPVTLDGGTDGIGRLGSTSSALTYWSGPTSELELTMSVWVCCLQTSEQTVATSEDEGVEMISSMFSLTGSVLCTDDEVSDDAGLRTTSELKLEMSAGGSRLATSE